MNAKPADVSSRSIAGLVGNESKPEPTAAALGSQPVSTNGEHEPIEIVPTTQDVEIVGIVVGAIVGTGSAVERILENHAKARASSEAGAQMGSWTSRRCFRPCGHFPTRTVTFERGPRHGRRTPDDAPHDPRSRRRIRRRQAIRATVRVARRGQPDAADAHHRPGLRAHLNRRSPDGAEDTAWSLQPAEPSTSSSRGWSAPRTAG